MLWSSWIIYISFAEKFKAKINTKILRFVTFTFCMLYLSQKLWLYLILNCYKGRTFKFCHGRHFA